MNINADQELGLIENSINVDEDQKNSRKRKHKEKDVITDFNDFICPRPELKIQLVWKQLTYTIENNLRLRFNFFKVFKSNCILKPQNGYLNSKELIAVIGKSGCGKLSLLQCLSGRKTDGVKGNVWINLKNCTPSKNVHKNLKV